MHAKGTSKRFWFALASLVTTAAIFGYLLRFVSVDDVLSLLRRVDRTGLALFVVLSMAQSLFRTWRFALLLDSAGHRCGRPALFLVVLVRNFFADLLPARLGTLVYVFIVHTRLGIPLPPAAASFALAFLFDILALVPLVLVAMGMIAASTHLPMAGLLIASLFLGTACLALIRYVPALCRWLATLFKKTQTLAELLTHTAAEIDRSRQAGLYLPLLLLSLLVRVAKYGALLTFLVALLRPLGHAVAPADLPKAFLAMCAAELSASLPISGIAGFGAYEGTWTLVFQWMGFDTALAALTAVSHHLFTQVYGYLLGAAALLMLMTPLFGKAQPMSAETSFRWRPFVLKLALCIGLTAALLWLASAMPWAGAKQKPDNRTPADQARLNALAKQLPGRILFDSNRSGSFGIYTIATDGTGRTRLVDAPKWQEMFPDPSPDGRRVVYARAASTARRAKAEIWMTDVKGEQPPRRLAPNGTFPTFSSDGQTVYFERNRQKVIALNLSTGQEREIFPLKNARFAGRQVVKPRLSADGRHLAFTSDVPGRWHAWHVDLKKTQANKIGEGCEPVFSEHPLKALWISPSGNERTAVWQFTLANNTRQMLTDAQAPWGHEYFPTLAANGRFLLYAACPPGQHSHETANYQLFVADLTTHQCTRITFDGDTNRWPKYLPGSHQ